MIVRYSVKVQGIVQGVGYRPFVYSLATHMGLSGWVINDARGVLIEVQGNHDDVKSFIDALYHDAPALAVVEQINTTSIDVVAENGFCIRSSQKGQPRTLISPDIALCDDCIKDMNNSKDRR